MPIYCYRGGHFRASELLSTCKPESDEIPKVALNQPDPTTSQHRPDPVPAYI